MEKGIIERAYELAPQCGTVDEVRSALRREGYSNVDAHLSGPRIRADLTKLLSARAKAERSETSAAFVEESAKPADGSA
jgi:hypothetical protein